MNTKQGLKRFGIVIVLFWVVGWSGYALLGNQQQNVALDELALVDRQYPERYDDPACASQQVIWMEQLNEGSRKLQLAVEIGLFVPVGLLILAPFVWFIYRGFKPKSLKQPSSSVADQ